MLFSKLILIVALIPIFTFQRVEGRIFRPMAFTIAGAIIGATLVTLTLVPLACSFLLKGGRSGSENFVSRWITVGYTRLLRHVLRAKWRTVAVAVAAAGRLAVAGPPPRHRVPPQARRGEHLAHRQHAAVRSPGHSQGLRAAHPRHPQGLPRVQTIYSQLGRPDDGTDPKGFNNIEIAVYLPPHDSGPPAAGTARSWTRTA